LRRGVKLDESLQLRHVPFTQRRHANR
jgi:hypothetical protein